MLCCFRISEDAGESYRAVDSPGQTYAALHDVNVHPYQPDWIITRVMRNACVESERRELDEGCAADLFLSQVTFGCFAAKSSEVAAWSRSPCSHV